MVVSCVALGLGVRCLVGGPLGGGEAGTVAWGFGKYAGVILWCWVVHAGVRVVWPRLGVWGAAGAMVLIAWGVELAQMTDVPRWLSQKHVLLRLVFGEVFSVWDLVAVLVAGVLVVPVDLGLRGLERRAKSES